MIGAWITLLWTSQGWTSTQSIQNCGLTGGSIQQESLWKNIPIFFLSIVFSLLPTRPKAAALLCHAHQWPGCPVGLQVPESGINCLQNKTSKTISEMNFVPFEIIASSIFLQLQKLANFWKGFAFLLRLEKRKNTESHVLPEQTEEVVN